MIELQKSDFKSMQGQLGRCKNCPHWWLHSPEEIKRHRRLLHPNTSVTNMFENMMEEQPTDQSKKLQHCRFKVHGKICNLSFPTYHQLLTVKEESIKRDIKSVKKEGRKK